MLYDVLNLKKKSDAIFSLKWIFIEKFHATRENRHATRENRHATRENRHAQIRRTTNEFRLIDHFSDR
jgi:hypothetical protein